MSDTTPFQPVAIEREWALGDRREQVQGMDTAQWLVPDLLLAVKDAPVFQVPLAFLDLSAHTFDTRGGLIDFAIHMRHVNESNPDEPVIFDQWGRILDGRHRIVKALLEGRATIPAKKVPDGTSPSYFRA